MNGEEDELRAADPRRGGHLVRVEARGDEDVDLAAMQADRRIPTGGNVFGADHGVVPRKARRKGIRFCCIGLQYCKAGTHVGRDVLRDAWAGNSGKADAVVVNGENAAGGLGITPKIAEDRKSVV